MTKSQFIRELVSERKTINLIELTQECVWAGYSAPSKWHLTKIIQKVGYQNIDMGAHGIIECPVYTI